MTSVQVASTTDAAAASGPPGTGQNENIIPISDARQASSETWLFTLPTLDPRAGSGFTFSVVGEAHGVSEDYPLTIRTPVAATQVLRALRPSSSTPTKWRTLASPRCLRATLQAATLQALTALVVLDQLLPVGEEGRLVRERMCLVRLELAVFACLEGRV